MPEEKFKEVAEAYAVLSDDAKRREYDAAGHIGVDQRWTTEDLFRDFQFGDFFGGRFDDLSSIFGDFFGRRTRPSYGMGRGVDLRYDLDLTLEEAARGGDHEIRVTRSEQCDTCRGNGARPGDETEGLLRVQRDGAEPAGADREGHAHGDCDDMRTM